MQLPRILDSLGYSGSRNFLRRGTAEFERAPDIGHILRAAGKGCRLEGVYTLRPPTTDGQQNSGSIIPVVYVCKAEDEAAADRIHRLVWNQDIVPFLLIHTPRGLRLYSGFERKPNGTTHTGLLEPLIEFNNLHDQLAEFHADAIDSVEIWQRRGAQIRPEARVYWSLLASLKELAGKLRAEHGAGQVNHPPAHRQIRLSPLPQGSRFPLRTPPCGVENRPCHGLRSRRHLRGLARDLRKTRRLSQRSRLPAQIQR